MSVEGKRAWVKIPSDDRDILLGNGGSPPTRNPPRPPRTANLHEISAYDYMVMQHQFQAEHDPGPPINNDVVSTNSHETTASTLMVPVGIERARVRVMSDRSTIRIRIQLQLRCIQLRCKPSSLFVVNSK